MEVTVTQEHRPTAKDDCSVMLDSFMKQEVLSFTRFGWDWCGLYFYFFSYSHKANGLEHILPKTTSVARFRQRTQSAGKVCFPYESINQRTSPYCVTSHCLILFREDQSIVKLWEEECWPRKPFVRLHENGQSADKRLAIAWMASQVHGSEPAPPTPEHNAVEEHF